MKTKIYKTNGGFVVSRNDCWRPGFFETIEAAEKSTAFSDEFIIKIQKQKGFNLISINDLA